MPTKNEVEQVLAEMVSNIKIEKLDQNIMIFEVDYPKYISKLFDIFEQK